MDDLSYNNSQLTGYGFPASEGGLRNNISYPNDSNACTQRSPTDQDTFSPITEPRHDSVYSLPLSQSPRFPTLQRHKAEFQPDAIGLTPHFNTAYSHQSVDMSRDTSHASYQSSISSGQQYSGSQQIQSYRNEDSLNSTDMRRTVSMYTDVAATQDQHLRAHPLQHQVYMDQFNPNLINVYPSAFSTMPQDTAHNARLDNPVINYRSNDTTDISFLDFAIGVYGSGHSDHMITPMQQTRPRAKSDAYPNHRPHSHMVLSEPQIRINARAVVSPDPTTSSSPPAVEHSKRRRRKQTPPSDSESDRITGHVLSSGKFQCSDPQCEDLRFGRQADFRRHFNNVHADKAIEHFCPVTGCERSKKPSKKSKGRSFGVRKDKMEEHVQTVHRKLRKRKRSPEPESEEDEEEGEDIGDVGQAQFKLQRSF